jgi:hypothetical protein
MHPAAQNLGCSELAAWQKDGAGCAIKTHHAIPCLYLSAAALSTHTQTQTHTHAHTRSHALSHMHKPHTAHLAPSAITSNLSTSHQAE